MAVPQLAVACGVGELVGRPEAAVHRVDVDAAEVAGAAAGAKSCSSPGRSPAGTRTGVSIVPAGSAGVRPVTYIDMKSVGVSVPDRM